MAELLIFFIIILFCLPLSPFNIWSTKRSLNATKVKPKSMQTPPLNLAYKTTFIINFFIVMTGIELFIVIGGCYALYTVGMAIATNIDYYSTNKEEQLVKRGRDS